MSLVNSQISRNRIHRNSFAIVIFALAAIASSLFASDPWSTKASTLDQSTGKTQPQEHKQPLSSDPDDFRYPIQEGFEGFSLATTQFSSYVPTCDTTGCGWSVQGNYHHSGEHSVWAPNVAAVSDQQLVLNPGGAITIPADASKATLSFWHAYSFESTGNFFFDGGVLEVFSNGAWSDSDLDFITGGYNATLSLSLNPLTGRPAWSGQTLQGFTEVEVSLLAYAGQSIRIRFREGTDATNASFGWWIDDIKLVINSPSSCTAPEWGTRASYPHSASGLATASFNGKIYSFGGRDTTQTVLANAYSTGSAPFVWSSIAPLPQPRMGASAVSSDQYIYILGGLDSDINPTTTLWRYSPTNNSYTVLAPFTHPTGKQAAVINNGKIYRIGGLDDDLHAVNTVEVYNINSNTWSSTTNYPIPISSPNALSFGRYIYTAGGTNTTYQTKTYRFDPTTSTWDDNAIPDLLEGYYDGIGALVNGRWILAGGGPSNYTKSVSWDPATNLWSALPTMDVAVHDAGSAVLNQSIYVIAGTDLSGNAMSATQYYTDQPCIPDPATCMLQFTDVDPSSTFYPYIKCLACYGIISGYSDGTFRPGNDVTRAQIAKIVSNASGFTEMQTHQTFLDISPSHTFYTYIERLASRNIIGGYPCGGPGEPCDVNNMPYFRPASNATRGQLAKIVCKAFNCVSGPSQQSFADVPVNHTFYHEIGMLYELGSITGYACGGPGEPCEAGNLPYFRPGAKVSRGQTAKIISSTFFPGCPTP